MRSLVSDVLCFSSVASGKSTKSPFLLPHLASLCSASTRPLGLLSLTSPWSLFLVLSSLRSHTSGAGCQPGILVGLVHLIHVSVSQGLCRKQIYTEAERERLWLGSGCSLSLRMWLLLLCSSLRCSEGLGLSLFQCRMAGIAPYSLSLHIHSVKKKKRLKNKTEFNPNRDVVCPFAHEQLRDP